MTPCELLERAVRTRPDLADFVHQHRTELLEALSEQPIETLEVPTYGRLPKGLRKSTSKTGLPGPTKPSSRP